MEIDERLISIINDEILLFESDVSGHAYERIKKRLDTMKYSGDITPEEYEQIRKNLNLILSNNFDSKSYGIFLGKFKPNPNSIYYTNKNIYDPGIPFYQIISNDGIFAKDSTGDEMWAIVRDNVITTIMLRKSTQRKSVENERGEDGGLGVDVVIKNIEDYLAKKKEKNEIEKLKQYQKEEEKKKIININGIFWVIAPNEEILYKKNNPKHYITFDDIFDYPEWNNEVKEKVLDYITSKFNV